MSNYEREILTNEVIKKLYKYSQQTPAAAAGQAAGAAVAGQAAGAAAGTAARGTATTNQPNEQALYGLAEKLVANLARQIDPGNAPAGANPFDSANSAPLNTENLKNFQTLLEYLATNKVSYEGKRIAYKPGDGAPDQPADADQLKSQGTPLYYELYKIDPVTQKYPTTNYWAIKEPLIAFLNYLKTFSVSKDGNKVMKLMVNGIIDSVNKLPGMEAGKISKEAPAPQQATNNDILDGFQTPELSVQGFDYQYMIQHRDNDFAGVPITLAGNDLSSSSSLQAWLNKNNFQLNENGKKVPSNDPKVNKCGIAFALYNRAKYLKDNKSNSKNADKYAKNADYYLAQITSITPTLTDGDNKTCVLGRADGVVGGASATTGTAGAGAAGAAGNLTAEVMTKLIEVIRRAPLRENQFNFGAIKTFVENDVFKAIFEKSLGDVASNYNTTKSQIIQLYQNLINKAGISSLDVSEGASWNHIVPTKIGNKNEMTQFVNNSDSILNYYKNFLNMLRQITYGNPALSGSDSVLEEQIGISQRIGAKISVIEGYCETVKFR